MTMYFPTQKTGAGLAYPVYATGVSDSLTRAEPIITPAEVQSRYMKNIPTKFAHDELTVDDFKDQIKLAINRIELELDIDIYPVERTEKHPYTHTEYINYCFLRTKMGPIMRLEHICVRSANGENLYEIPPQWIDPGNFHFRQINVIPLMSTYGINQFSNSTQPAGLVLLTIMGGLGFIPSYWEIKYTSGVSKTEGQVPVPVNELIGLEAAHKMISMAQAANTKNSVSISQDGLSQSSSGPGPEVYKRRMDDIQDQIDLIKRSLKKRFSKKFLTGFA